MNGSKSQTSKTTMLTENYSLAIAMKTFAAVIVLSSLILSTASAQNAVSKLPMQLAVAEANTGYGDLKTDEALPNAVVSRPTPEAPAPQSEAAAGYGSKESLARTLQVTAAKLVTDHMNGSTELLRSGHSLDLIATLGIENNPMEQQSVDVHVTYDARPVGGILNIRVELVPVFGGIGAAVRPTISQEFAQAVDDFDDDFIGDTITKLTDELATQIAAR
jgi:hypothetical protein